MTGTTNTPRNDLMDNRMNIPMNLPTSNRIDTPMSNLIDNPMRSPASKPVRFPAEPGVGMRGDMVRSQPCANIAATMAPA
ncbi:hypothetical protein OU994_09015 [Pseudoduganella sp. SL102]|uniref:hypothetical protein n=1 Tax=Pseudoduganella sp. SL102 TaxID=2995154 RepID=UPI00248BEEAD|nr:hypothetical protein [Pseudoduganella sp. SL102]WBS04402.1 hypothetical protein OU994_09015 [Pseudoduganella sp. SL102]